MLKEFKEFAMKGNMLDLAIGVVIGAAFGKIVDAFVSQIIMPPIGAVTPKGGSFSQWGIPLGDKGQIGLGAFFDAMLQFVIVAFALFVIVKAVNRFKKEAPAAPAEPPKSEVLLEEIRDLLRSR